jgi:hypothetical protein
VDTSYCNITREEEKFYIDQLKTNVETNKCSEVPTSLIGNLDSNPTLLEMKSYLNYIRVNHHNSIRVHISPKLSGAKIKLKEQDNNSDIPKFKRDSEIQVPKCMKCYKRNQKI